MGCVIVMDIFQTIKTIGELGALPGKATLLNEHVRILTSQVLGLQAQIGDLKSQVDDKDKQIEDLKLAVDEQKRQKDEKGKRLNVLVKQLDKLQKWPPLEFNPKTGIWVDEETQIHYCPSCKSKNIIAPLQEREHGWQCNIKECDQFYQNTDVTKALSAW